ncbi:MAG: hypothetical protein WBM64_08755 [Woeseiaceae bacterium]
MYGIAFIVLLPLFGWWLIRTTRSYERLVTVVNDNDVDLGFLSFRGKVNTFLLFSDVTFVLWLVRRKYVDQALPPVVVEALEESRRSYLLVLFGFAAFILVVNGLQFGSAK